MLGKLSDILSSLRRQASPPRTPGQGNGEHARQLNGNIEISDLLGRRPVNLDTPELQRFIAGKVVLVTGAGGSIGSEICRQTLKFCPAKLVLVEQAEGALFEIDRELRQRWVGSTILPRVASITDRARIDEILADETPHVIFHCAAHKHVPMMECNPREAIKNNVFGTQVVAESALAHDVAAFVMVSTDKAVNPTSVMGASKRVAEMVIQSLTSAGKTRFVAVRFGNVLGSSGSVVPIFQKQIESGGPVTVTHPDMQRYFMTIPEASQLVMQAGAIGQGGEIFVLDMGQAVKIVDLAYELIKRNGLVPNKDIDVKFTGVRPGEKLYEELSLSHEETCPTSHSKIHVWQLTPSDPREVELMLADLKRSIKAFDQDAIAALARAVPEYTPESLAQPKLRLAPIEKAA